MRFAVGSYVFLKARSGETVPALALPDGNCKPLHSMVDPKREAQRLISAITDDTGFVIILGLGGGFAAEAALELTSALVLVIDFDNDGIKQLLASKDYSAVLNNERFTLLTEPSNEKIKNFVIENYKPSLDGGIKVIPLRTRTEQDIPLFEKTASVIQEAINIIRADYSVQAHFGKRWFCNIIRNLKNMETLPCLGKNLPAFNTNIGEAAVVAAGPSLDIQLALLAEYKSRQVFIISSDTAMGTLLHYGIEPDVVVSIDCQNISYHHFLGYGSNRKSIPLVLDIASPPLLSGLTSSPVFFSGDHPLAQYICANWHAFPVLDTSGGNVTYTCLSLAEYLGAQRITLFGADFAYINSRTYARGTYIYPFFERRQNRFFPIEAQMSAFLYRSPFLPKCKPDQQYCETSQMYFYRKKLEEKAAAMTAEITCAKGHGAPISLQKTAVRRQAKIPAPSGRASRNSADFLEQYRNDIAALPKAKNVNYMRELNSNEKHIFITLLPYMAFLKHRNPAFNTEELINEVKRCCIREIDLIIN